MPQDTGVGRNVVLDGLDFARLTAGLGAGLRGCSPTLALSRFPVPCSGVRTPVPDSWRAFGRNPARSGRHGDGTPGNGAAAPAGSVSPGTHLVREWNGRTYQVEILDSGYRFDGKTYPSLTAITKRITGTHWSGPRFFGLTPKRKA